MRQWLIDRAMRHTRTTGGEHDGERVSRHLYASILVLAVLVTADDHPTRPFEVAVVIAVTAAILVGMEMYADLLGREVTLRRPITSHERREAARELMSVLGTAELPLVFLIAAGFGAISTSLALWLAKTSTFVVLFSYGYLARQLAGRSRLESLVAGLTVAGLGVALALGKAYVHL